MGFVICFSEPLNRFTPSSVSTAVTTMTNRTRKSVDRDFIAGSRCLEGAQS